MELHGEGAPGRWKHTVDHSKWCVGANAAKGHVACIGDINRMSSQAKRGGGAVCSLSDTTFIANLEGVVNDDLFIQGER